MGIGLEPRFRVPSESLDDASRTSPTTKFESRRSKRHGKYARRGSERSRRSSSDGRPLRANDRLNSVAIVSASVTERRRESFKHDAVARARVDSRRAPIARRRPTPSRRRPRTRRERAGGRESPASRPVRRTLTVPDRVPIRERRWIVRRRRGRTTRRRRRRRGRAASSRVRDRRPGETSRRVACERPRGEHPRAPRRRRRRAWARTRDRRRGGTWDQPRRGGVGARRRPARRQPRGP